MKSSKGDLKKRGLTDKSDIDKYKAYTEEQLLQLLNSKVAADRSSAVILLREKRSYDNEDYINLLLEKLAKEKALYTKIEICKSLEAGNKKTALLMCNYLGTIGNNQYKRVADAVSKKKCYPLQRDIISRTLSRMDKSVLPTLMNQLDIIDRQKVSELIDAIGYMVFYNEGLATSSNFNHIQNTFEHYKNDELTVWKITLCCSAFPLEESRSLLSLIKKNYTHPTIQKEVARSLSFIG